jgi:hypothetical protein
MVVLLLLKPPRTLRALGGRSAAGSSHSRHFAAADSPRKRAADPLVYGRTKISNGSQFLPGIDNRSLWARRCKDIYNGYLAAVPGATVDQRSHLKRASILEAKLEYLEAQLFATTETDEDDNAKLDIYQRTAGQHRRALMAAGLRQSNAGPEGHRPKAKSPYMLAIEAEQKIDNERNEKRRVEFEEKQRTVGRAAGTAGGTEKL